MTTVIIGDSVRITHAQKNGHVTHIHNIDECTVREDGITGVSYRVYTHLLEVI